MAENDTGFQSSSSVIDKKGTTTGELREMPPGDDITKQQNSQNSHGMTLKTIVPLSYPK